MSEGIPIRILVVDDDVRVRSALQMLLEQELEQISICESEDMDSLAVHVNEFRPHLVLLDWELPGRPAAALLLVLHGLKYRPRVIVLSTRSESKGEALAAGADAFVSKSEPPERLLSSLRRVVQEMRSGGV